ncbi:hypothetical protein H5P28_11480 [Ruficoccus amylovorans]|uniref:DUF4347 domain-containing protein n=1 Tax=Ruficoccus amylovorans TaxID=1804625 RepID=A0A842HFR3_9BACT|nr:hypothetical protein [Ruficoccus amylovorans]MBC2594878.1 hypothetical protein [Ruficoccus amylovorans]
MCVKYPHTLNRKSFTVHDNPDTTTVIMVNMDGQFFSVSAQDYTPLLRAMESELSDYPNAAVYVVKGETDAAAMLAKHTGIRRFIYIAHGVEPGFFQGQTPETTILDGVCYPQLSDGIAFAVSPMWEAFKEASAPDAKLELISCRVGGNSDYLHQLANATDAQVIAYSGTIMSNSVFLHKPGKVVVEPTEPTHENTSPTLVTAAN